MDTKQRLNTEQYLAFSEHSHQVELFAWAAVATLHGLDVGRLWVETAPSFMHRPKVQDLIDELNLLSLPIPELRWLHAIPNGGSRGSTSTDAARVGARMRAEGVRKGVADIFLPVKCGQFCGLYIELKKFGGKLTKEQKEFGKFVLHQGFFWKDIQGYVEAINVITWYVTLGSSL